MAITGNIGSFFGGLAQGMGEGMKLDLQGQELIAKKEEAAARRAERARAKRTEALQWLKDFRPVITRAVELGDKNTVSDLFEGYGRQFGVDPKAAIDFANKDPETFKDLLELTGGAGLTLDKILPSLGDPMLRGALRLALGEANANIAATGATSAALTGGTGGATRQPTGGPAGTSVPAPTDDLQAQAGRLEAQEQGLIKAIETHSKANNTQMVTVLSTLLNGVRTRLASITEGPAVDAAKQDRQPVTEQDIAGAETRLAEAGRRDLMARLRPGMRRSAFDAVLAAIGGPANGQPVDSFPVGEAGGASTVPMDSIQRMLQSLKAGGPQTPQERQVATAGATAQVAPGTGPRTPIERDVAKHRQTAQIDQSLRTPPEGVIRDTGATTMGNVPGRPLPTVNDARVDSERATGRERVAFKRVEDFQKEGSEAAKTLQRLEVFDSLIPAAGITGSMTGPIRLAIGNLYQTLTGRSPSGLNELQLMETTNLELAIGVLKDFTGNDSDRDVLNAIKAKPNIMRTPEVNKAMVSLAKEEMYNRVERNINAQRWVSNYGSLTAKNPAGKTFDDVAEQARLSRQPVMEAVLGPLGYDLDALRKGVLTKKRAKK